MARSVDSVAGAALVRRCSSREARRGVGDREHDARRVAALRSGATGAV